MDIYFFFHLHLCVFMWKMLVDFRLIILIFVSFECWWVDEFMSLLPVSLKTMRHAIKKKLVCSSGRHSLASLAREISCVLQFWCSIKEIRMSKHSNKLLVFDILYYFTSTMYSLAFAPKRHHPMSRVLVDDEKTAIITRFLTLTMHFIIPTRGKREVE